MKNTFFISAVISMLMLLSSCGGKDSKEVEAVSSNVSTTDNLVTVLTLEKTMIAHTIDYTANILAFEELQVAPATPGRIDNIFVEVGDNVKKGDLLFRMDRTTLNQQKVQLASLATDLARLDTLLLTNSVAQQVYDQMKTQYDVAKSNVEYMEENTLMKAPFSGIITGKYFEDGELYSGSFSAATGGKAAIVTLMQIDPVKVRVSVSEQFLPLVKMGMKAFITSDVYGDREFEGKVRLVYPTVDAATRTFQVELEVPNRAKLLRPGMFARVSMNLGETESFAVPSDVVLVQEGTGIRYVFVENNGTAVRVNVTLGKRYNDMVEVISGSLHAGDRIISKGQARLVSGDKVKVVK